MSYVEISKDSFDKEVLNEKVCPVLVDFWATWCGPCQMLSPVIDGLADELDGEVKVCKMDCDENSDFIMEMGVMTIPCLVLFVGGEEKGRLIGYNEKEAIIDFINENK
ncbi:MAG: thioredoxin [Clostridia bacterium]|nr:thioredoxin [Clostridia bacterium]